MSEVITTLNKKGDRSVEVYPNIKEANIPTGAVTTGKLANSSVTTGKLADASVTTGKLADTSVTTGKLVDSSVTTGKLADLSVNRDKLTGNKYINQYNYDLSSYDLSSYDVDGGSVFIEFNYDSTTSSNTYFDDLEIGFNYSRGGYFQYSSNNYVIIEASIKISGGVSYLDLLGVIPSGIKRVSIPISALIECDYSYKYIDLI